MLSRSQILLGFVVLGLMMLVAMAAEDVTAEPESTNSNKTAAGDDGNGGVAGLYGSLSVLLCGAVAALLR